MIRCLQIACSMLASLVAFSATESLQISAQSENDDYNMWVIRTTDISSLEPSLHKVKAQSLGQLGSLDGFYKFDFSKTSLNDDEIEDLLESQTSILWHEKQEKNLHFKTQDIPGSPLDDPLSLSSWHFANGGQSKGKRGEDLNVLPAWDWGVNGSGRLIAVIDTGIDLDHPDLVGNIRHDMTLDLVGSGSNENVLNEDENHGTAVAGIIAATDNDIGSVGVAYGAHLVPIRYLGEAHSESQTADALSHKNTAVSVYNNSWGPAIGDEDSEDLIAMQGPGNLCLLALNDSVTQGRNGKGSIFVFSAGNSGDVYGSNVNYNGWANNRMTIAVAAMGNQGERSYYSEVGAPILVTAPSGGQSLGINTTDRVGIDGYTPQNYYSDFTGTSASAPMVSGVVALMLEVNPDLGWRDVQHILAKTAVKIDPEDEGWTVNGAGLQINDKYGFGKVDASAAIQTAASWSNASEEVRVSATRYHYSSLPQGSTLQSTVTVDENIKIEQVQITPTMNHSNWGDLHITITSPSGTESTLATPHTDEYERYGSWDYTSVQFLDETSAGEWTLKVTDEGTAGSGTLSSWAIRIWGTNISDNDNQNPLAEDDNFIETSFPATLDVLANDTDPNADSVQIISLYQAEFGNLTVTENNGILYTPIEEKFKGIDQFGYTISDGRGGISDAIVNLIHPGPVAMPDQAVTVQGIPVTIPVLQNDFDRSGDPVRLVSLAEEVTGEIEINDNSLTYTPPSGYVGLQTVEYTITDDIHGEDSSTVRLFTSSQNDFALIFDGYNDSVIFPSSDALNITNSISFEASIYLQSYGENGSVGFGRIIDRDNYNLFVNGTDHVFYPDSCLVVAIEIPNTNGTITTANTPANSIQLNRWHQVAFTYDGVNTPLFYIDGERVDTEFSFANEAGYLPFEGSIASKTADLYIGENSAGTRAFEGVISWVRIWNKELTQQQIENFGNDLAPSDQSGLAGWFRFDEGSNIQTTDSVGLSNTGIISEALWVPTDPSLLATALDSTEKE